MSIVRYEPWGLLNQLHGEINRLNNARCGKNTEENRRLATNDWVPAVDIEEQQDRYVIRADVPGVDPKAIEVRMEDGVLTIKGERSSESREERKAYRRVERVRGSFLRRFSLPDSADTDAISAKSNHGVLEIVIPKQEKLQPKRIQVES